MRCGLKEILDIGEAGGFAIPAFNVYNLETAQGVMQAAIDASMQDIEENIAITKSVADMATGTGITIEGELGEVGRGADGASPDYTAVEDAARLVLHGGSGVPGHQILAKVNFGMDVCCALLDGIRAVGPGIPAVDLFMKEPTSRVTEFAVRKIKLLGANQ